jgi:hypothetical protein
MFIIGVMLAASTAIFGSIPMFRMNNEASSWLPVGLFSIMMVSHYGYSKMHSELEE